MNIDDAKCKNCENEKLVVNGPIWADEIYDKEFVEEM